MLSGGGARGAYEAGVLAYIYQELPKDLLEKGAIRVFSGTSVGAIHASYLAATAHRPRHDVGRLVDLWRSLRIERMLRLSPTDLLRLPRELLALFRADTQASGILVNSGHLRDVVTRNTPWGNIQRNLKQGHLDALTVSATHIQSGHTTVFVDQAKKELPAWSRDRRVHPRCVNIGPAHALASAAIPILFPPVKIDGAYYSDGGLRQNTPLSPALRLGCNRVLVVGLRYDAIEAQPAIGHCEPLGQSQAARGEVVGGTDFDADENYPGAFHLLGKVVDVLMLDHLDYDLLRLEGFNTILREGRQTFGPSFMKSMSETAMNIRGAEYREVDTLVIRPSRDLGQMANEFTDVLRTQMGMMSGWMFGRLTSSGALGESDLLSYLLFDGRLGAALIELGRADADAMRDDLIEFFKGE